MRLRVGHMLVPGQRLVDGSQSKRGDETRGTHGPRLRGSGRVGLDVECEQIREAEWTEVDELAKWGCRQEAEREDV